MKIAVISLIGNVPTRLSSHNAGWSFTIRSIIQSQYGEEAQIDFLKQTDDIHPYDAVCINNGINFKAGAWNFIGGPPKTLERVLMMLSLFNGEIFSYNEVVDLNHLVSKRKELANLKERTFPKVGLRSTEHVSSDLILGDSHSVSIYKPGYAISRNDGRTLYGALRNNGKWIKDIVSQRPYKNVHLYFGNIDVRFHLFRQADWSGTNDLVWRYVNLIKELQDEGITVEVQAVIPIEDESRKIPGSGLYLKQPYFGTREERQKIVSQFNNTLLIASKGVDCKPFVFHEWEFDVPLEFDKMEARQSVHIRPEQYYFNQFKETFKIK